MPWRGPQYRGEFPSLGWSIGDWIEEHCVIPDGDDEGLPFLLTDEMWTFLVCHYRLKPTATQQRWRSAWAYRRSQLVRPQKWGKGPFSAAMICAEAIADVRFAGWDADGEPVGRPWPTPWIQVTATNEDQTKNVYRALVPMITGGPLADLIPDVGNTRINIGDNGLIEPVTNSGARLGQRITFAEQDETHQWLESNGGWELEETQRRNLAGTGGRAAAFTNGWDPSEQSVAQRTAEARAKDIYRDHRQPPRPNLANKAERRKALRLVYGNSMGRKGWVDIDRIDAEAMELAEKNPGQALRYFWNIPDAGSGSWMDDVRWAQRGAPRAVADGTSVVLALDGSDVDDWTGIRAETQDGYQFTPTYGPDRRPTIWNPADHGGQVPRLEVHAAVDELMTRYRVVRMYADPPYFESEIDAWAERYGDKRVLRWETYRAVQMHTAAERLLVDVAKADSTWRHDGCTTTQLHIRNARKAARTGGRYVLKKASPQQKIDLCVVSIMAHEAASDVTGGNLWPKPPNNLIYTASSTRRRR